MVLMVPSIGVLILIVLLLVLFFGAPAQSTRGLVMTLINVLLIGLLIYFILGLFGVIAF